MTTPSVKAIETFVKAVELGSIRQAAQAQAMSHQAASQAIAQLEHHLAVRLLHRTTRSLTLTEEGRTFLENVQPALAALDRALLLARETKDEISGPLRIVGPKSCFAPILMPVLDAFCTAYPDIKPDIQLDDGVGNWVEDRVDVGFRIGTSPHDSVISRPLFPFQLVVCASPRYLDTYGLPSSLEELSQHRCSMYRHAPTGKVSPWFLSIDGKIEHRVMVPALATNDVDMELQAILAGQVIGQAASATMAPLVRAGKLVPILLQHTCAPMSLHVYYGSRAAQPKRVRAFIDLVISRLADCPDYVLSERELAGALRAWKRSRKHHA